MEEDGMVQHLRQIEKSLREEYDIGATLQEQLEQAVAEEDYERAAQLRDKLKRRVSRRYEVRLGTMDREVTELAPRRSQVQSHPVTHRVRMRRGGPCSGPRAGSALGRGRQNRCAGSGP